MLPYVLIWVAALMLIFVKNCVQTINVQPIPPFSNNFLKEVSDFDSIVEPESPEQQSNPNEIRIRDTMGEDDAKDSETCSDCNGEHQQHSKELSKVKTELHHMGKIFLDKFFGGEDDPNKRQSCDDDDNEECCDEHKSADEKMNETLGEEVLLQEEKAKNLTDEVQKMNQEMQDAELGDPNCEEKLNSGEGTAKELTGGAKDNQALNAQLKMHFYKHCPKEIDRAPSKEIKSIDVRLYREASEDTPKKYDFIALFGDNRLKQVPAIKFTVLDRNTGRSKRTDNYEPFSVSSYVEEDPVIYDVVDHDTLKYRHKRHIPILFFNMIPSYDTKLAESRKMVFKRFPKVDISKNNQRKRSCDIDLQDNKYLKDAEFLIKNVNASLQVAFNNCDKPIPANGGILVKKFFDTSPLNESLPKDFDKNIAFGTQPSTTANTLIFRNDLIQVPDLSLIYGDTTVPRQSESNPADSSIGAFKADKNRAIADLATFKQNLQDFIPVRMTIATTAEVARELTNSIIYDTEQEGKQLFANAEVNFLMRAVPEENFDSRGAIYNKAFLENFNNVDRNDDVSMKLADFKKFHSNEDDALTKTQRLTKKALIPGIPIDKKYVKKDVGVNMISRRSNGLLQSNNNIKENNGLGASADKGLAAPFRKRSEVDNKDIRTVVGTSTTECVTVNIFAPPSPPWESVAGLVESINRGLLDTVGKEPTVDNSIDAHSTDAIDMYNADLIRDGTLVDESASNELFKSYAADQVIAGSHDPYVDECKGTSAISETMSNERFRSYAADQIIAGKHAPYVDEIKDTTSLTNLIDAIVNSFAPENNDDVTTCSDATGPGNNGFVKNPLYLESDSAGLGGDKQLNKLVNFVPFESVQNEPQNAEDVSNQGTPAVEVVSEFPFSFEGGGASVPDQGKGLPKPVNMDIPEATIIDLIKSADLVAQSDPQLHAQTDNCQLKTTSTTPLTIPCPTHSTSTTERLPPMAPYEKNLYEDDGEGEGGNILDLLGTNTTTTEAGESTGSNDGANLTAPITPSNIVMAASSIPTIAHAIVDAQPNIDQIKLAKSLTNDDGIATTEVNNGKNGFMDKLHNLQKDLKLVFEVQEILSGAKKRSEKETNLRSKRDAYYYVSHPERNFKSFGDGLVELGIDENSEKMKQVQGLGKLFLSRKSHWDEHRRKRFLFKSKRKKKKRKKKRKKKKKKKKKKKWWKRLFGKKKSHRSPFLGQPTPNFH